MFLAPSVDFFFLLNVPATSFSDQWLFRMALLPSFGKQTFGSAEGFVQRALNKGGNRYVGAAAHFQKCAAASQSFHNPEIWTHVIQMRPQSLKTLIGAPKTSPYELGPFLVFFCPQNRQNTGEKTAQVQRTRFRSSDERFE